MLHKLEKRHGIYLGNGYKNDHACATFLEFTAHEQQIIYSWYYLSQGFKVFKLTQLLIQVIQKNCSLCYIFRWWHNTCAKQVFCVRQLKSATVEGLFSCFKNALCYMGIDGQCKANDWLGLLILVMANLRKWGLKEHLVKELPWMVGFWCLAHYLELSLKDALSSTYFTEIDELLL